jgi:hypothetical protein
MFQHQIPRKYKKDSEPTSDNFSYPFASYKVMEESKSIVSYTVLDFFSSFTA